MVLTPRVRVIIEKVLNFNKNIHAGHLVGLEHSLPAMTGGGQVPWANTNPGYNNRNNKTKTKMRFSVPLIILAEIILFARGPKRIWNLWHCKNSLGPSFLKKGSGHCWPWESGRRVFGRGWIPQRGHSVCQGACSGCTCLICHTSVIQLETDTKVKKAT